MTWTTWSEAETYCAWKGKRLPTEHEWEKAARGTDGRKYPWGDESPDAPRANYLLADSEDQSTWWGHTTPVGFYDGINTLADGTPTVDSPSPYGAYDMAGNTYEWTASWWDANETSSTDDRVLRGGDGQENWFLVAAQSSERQQGAHAHAPYNGFRCAQSNCPPGFAGLGWGLGCEYSDAVTCSGNGTVDDNGVCTCKVTWTGSSCADAAPPPSGMVLVSAGDFKYGPPANGDNWTGVKNLDQFAIDKYEVTAGEYKECVDAGICGYIEAHTIVNNLDDHPMNDVNYFEARTYCVWKGKRLPTEYEWEKAARGTDGRTYPWGEDDPDGTRSNHSVSQFGGFTPVDFFDGVNTLADGRQTVDSASPYGAYGMAGNVTEWTDSWLNSSNTSRVQRGGSMMFGSGDYLKPFYRTGNKPNSGWTPYGFRCAQ